MEKQKNKKVWSDDEISKIFENLFVVLIALIAVTVVLAIYDAIVYLQILDIAVSFGGDVMKSSDSDGGSMLLTVVMLLKLFKYLCIFICEIFGCAVCYKLKKFFASPELPEEEVG